MYWSARSRSQTPSSSFLAAIIDSYDKSKLCLPKFPYNRTPKRTCYELIKRLLGLSCKRCHHLAVAQAWL